MSLVHPFRPDPADPTLTSARRIADDVAHFARITATVEDALAAADLRTRQLAALPTAPGQAALARDVELRHLRARRRLLERSSADLCLGRMVGADGTIHWVGRIGLGGIGPDGPTAGTGEVDAHRPGPDDRLLLDWRSPGAAAFFAATPSDPRGLVSRRRYRWSAGLVVAYWDELLGEPDDPSALDELRLDADSTAVLEAGSGGGTGMREVLSTLHADQDAAIRADARGPLLVTGGPGTGKTVVALHRAAYLMSQDPQVSLDRGGVLVLGPHRPWLHHVSDVLPALGEDGVVVATLADLVPGADLRPAVDPAADLKDTPRVNAWVEAAVAVYEEPPTHGLDIDTPWGDLRVTPADWAESFGSAPSDLSHNAARDVVWEHLLTLLEEQYRQRHEPERWDSDDWDETAPGVPSAALRAVLGRDRALAETFSRGWTLLDPEDVVADLWSVPAYLRRAAPELDADQVKRLQRSVPDAFTAADAPFLDAARIRVGDRAAVRERHAAQSRARRDAREMEATIEHALSADLDGDHQVQMLRGEDLRVGLVDPLDSPVRDTGRLMGPFSHVVVDEAQELTDAEWQMVRSRCPSGSLTLVGDRTQARADFSESWSERLQRNGWHRAREHHLHLNYRTPAEIMDVAGAQVLAELPDADIPRSVRPGGVPVRRGAEAELTAVVAEHRERRPQATIGVVTVRPVPDPPLGPDIAWLSPRTAKGLEFDLVVVLAPAEFGAGRAGAVDRYVAQTRAAGELVILE